MGPSSWLSLQKKSLEFYFREGLYNLELGGYCSCITRCFLFVS